jgi:DNA-binding transcriptional LysR family regulator
VLEDWTPPLDGLCLYYPSRRHASAWMRALVELIREFADAQRKRPVRAVPAIRKRASKARKS